MQSSSSSKHTVKQPGLQVRTYLAALPARTRRHLQKLREAIRSAAPGAVESFGYGMPAFALNGKPFVWYAAWKNHSSFYPAQQGDHAHPSPNWNNTKSLEKGLFAFD